MNDTSLIDISKGNNGDETNNLIQNDQEKLYECNECHMKFKREASLAAHFDSVHAPKIAKDYLCPECDYKSSSLSHLKFHLSKHHKNPEELLKKAVESRYFTCPHCSKKFKQLNTLHEHVANDHENRKPYACDICGNEIKTLRLYKQHMGRHEMNKSKYKCNLCDAEFPQQILLFKHIRENHPKSHICEICGASFKRKENLDQHMRKHESTVEERKKFVCPVEDCKSTFTRESNLKTHMKSVHGGVLPYTCEICGKGFLYPSLLCLHMESHEQKPEPEIINLDDTFLTEGPFE